MRWFSCLLDLYIKLAILAYLFNLYLMDPHGIKVQVSAVTKPKVFKSLKQGTYLFSAMLFSLK